MRPVTCSPPETPFRNVTPSQCLQTLIETHFFETSHIFSVTDRKTAFHPMFMRVVTL